MVCCVLDYVSLVWHHHLTLATTVFDKLETLQKRVLRIILCRL